MTPTSPPLTRRERQILDVIYRQGTASAADIHEALPDAPTYTSVRGLLRVMVRKGLVRYERDGRRYMYAPSTPRPAAGRERIRHVVKTFFAGSPSAAMTALIGEGGRISEDELDRLDELVAQMRKRRRGR
jgi:predicted transcriptional regulator